MNNNDGSTDGEDIHSEIEYFRYSGEVNTANLLTAAKKRAKERGINNIIIASETGLSALEAVEVFRDSDVKIIVVTHYPSSTVGPRGRIPIGINRYGYDCSYNQNIFLR